MKSLAVVSNEEISSGYYDAEYVEGNLMIKVKGSKKLRVDIARSGRVFVFTTNECGAWLISGFRSEDAITKIQKIKQNASSKCQSIPIPAEPPPPEKKRVGSSIKE